MDEQQATQLMRDTAESARKLAAKGELTRYMAGYFDGRLDAFAIVASTDATRQLRAELDAELAALPRREE